MTRRVSLLLIALVLLAAACGDDDSTSTTTAASPTGIAAAPSTTNAPPTTPATTEAPTAVTFTGADGVESTIADTSRIVSLNGDITEIIFELGLGSQVVAVDVTTTYPPETESIPRVGFGQQLAAEPVLAFEPTVVIGDQLIVPGESLEQLRDAGVPVAIVETRTSIDDVEQHIMDVAMVLGVPDAGRELAERVKGEIADARSLAAEAASPRSAAFLYSRGPQQLFLFGQGNITQSLIESANAVDTVSASGIAGVVPLTPEALALAAPDVIIVPASGVGALGGLDAIATLPGVAETPAGENGEFLVYDDGLFLNLGPRIGQALRQLVLDLHPELAS